MKKNILIKEKSDKGVLRLIMNNSDQKNPLSETLMGELMDGATATDLVLTIVELLRKEGVV